MPRIDLHAHTHFSRDAVMSPAALVRRAEGRGLTHVAVTDHAGLEGAYAARQIAEAAGGAVEVIIGQEVRTAGGEILGLFIQEPIPSKLSPGLAAARIHAQGGIVIAPHPFDPLRPSLGTRGLQELGAQIDAVEGYNGRALLRGRDAEARRYARQHDLPLSLGSDAHSRPELGRSRIDLPDFAGPAELLQALGEASYHLASRAPWWLPASGWAHARWVLGWRPPRRPESVGAKGGQT